MTRYWKERDHRFRGHMEAHLIRTLSESQRCDIRRDEFIFRTYVQCTSQIQTAQLIREANRGVRSRIEESCKRYQAHTKQSKSEAFDSKEGYVLPERHVPDIELIGTS